MFCILLCHSMVDVEYMKSRCDNSSVGSTHTVATNVPLIDFIVGPCLTVRLPACDVATRSSVVITSYLDN